MKQNATRSTARSDTRNPSGEHGEMEENELHELFLDQLSDILNAEQQLIKALPRMALAATAVELTAAFEAHLAETENHIMRLEEVFTALEVEVKNKKCKAMEGLLQEGREIMAELEGSSALDAALIAAAQKVEHYEIASYGTVCAWAEHLGHEEAAQLLMATLDEEKAADEKLTAIAQNGVNASAD